MDDVPIRDNTIRLGQFLKLANLIDSGSDAKSVIADGLVTVNGEVELRRGRQLRRRSCGWIWATAGTPSRSGVRPRESVKPRDAACPARGNPLGSSP